MSAIADGRYEQVGTFNGNPLAMAAARANLSHVLDEAGYEHLDAMAARAREGFERHIADNGLPWRVVSVGAKGCVAFTGAPVRNYRDFLEINDRWGNLHWLLQHNGGVFLPPWGKVEQWLLSVQHTEADVDLLIANFGKLAAIAGEHGDTPGPPDGRRRPAPHLADEVVRRRRRRRRHRPRPARRRVLLAARRLRLRQDHHAADDRRLRATGLGADPARRARHGAAAAAPAAGEHRLPELRALPADDGPRQRRLRAALPEGGQGGRRPPRRRGPRADPDRRAGEAPARPALRRPAAARRPGPGARPQPAGAAARRAPRRPRRPAAQAPPAPAAPAPARARHHVRLRDARPGGSADHVATGSP